MSDRRVTRIVDFGMGNLRSVLNALRRITEDVAVVDDPTAVSDATHLVLPGVGAFGDGMAHLRERSWIPALERRLEEGACLLGLCLGMQLLLEEGTEHGIHPGLGWIEGRVVRLDTSPSARVPHVGWNDVVPTGRGVLLDGLSKTPTFYFVHSYHVVPSDADVVTGRTTDPHDFVATVERGRVFGAQFHPEKSHRDGLGLLANFVRAEPGC
jgi:imidazole glycerol-phosphate synthase subunit HisH